MDQLTKEILIESGVHFGHPTQKWNPGFKDYIAGQKNGIHIIDVQKTIENITSASKELLKIASHGGNIQLNKSRYEGLQVKISLPF